jgi:hypothetical protein
VRVFCVAGFWNLLVIHANQGHVGALEMGPETRCAHGVRFVIVFHEDLLDFVLHPILKIKKLIKYHH